MTPLHEEDGMTDEQQIRTPIEGWAIGVPDAPAERHGR
jgi:hypothetical protein